MFATAKDIYKRNGMNCGTVDLFVVRCYRVICGRSIWYELW